MQSGPQTQKELRDQRVRQTNPFCQFKEFNREIYRSAVSGAARWNGSLYLPPPRVLISPEWWECVDNQEEQATGGPGARVRWERDNMEGASPQRGLMQILWQPRALCTYARAHPREVCRIKGLGSFRLQSGRLALRWSPMFCTVTKWVYFRDTKMH